MKNINIFKSEKYQDQKYTEVKTDIYQTQDEYGKVIYCTSMSFEQEPEYDEGETSEYISQYPIEDVLDKFCVYVSDFYDDLNDGKSNVCYYEFSSMELKNIQKLKKSIIGKHVYNKEKNGCVKLIIK